MLKVLPSYISNLIAAGEVVQRPASVVKELMENAVDAGAGFVHVVIKDSGRTLIQVIDDGCGMSPEDACTAFLRHATSKIDIIEDLDSLATFGFRGEALASIAAVAEVTLRTRRAEDEMGYEVRIAESNIFQKGAVSAPVGSNFSVRNIFYNIPARRKFLKSDASEYRNILYEFYRVALTRPHISFKLTNNDTEVFNLPPANLKQRILSLIGKDIARELVSIDVKTSIVNVTGFIGRPEDARKTASNQYFFVNGRFFRSGYMQKAIMKAYSGLIPDGFTPSWFIYLETNQDRIDINIHPSKTEVKFEEESAVFEILHSAVKESLGKNSFVPSIDFDREGAPDIPLVKQGYYVPPPKINYDPLFNPFNTPNEFDDSPSTGGFEIDREFHGDRGYSEGDMFGGSEIQKSLFRDSGVSQKPVLQICGRYIVTSLKSGLMIVDIRRARERVLYEKYLNSVTRSENIVQQNLFATEVSVSEIVYSFICEHVDKIPKLGFNIKMSENSSAEDRRIIVHGLPYGFTDDVDSLGEIIDSLVNELMEVGADINEYTKEKVARSLAKAGASGNYGLLNNMEAQLLIDSLFACNNPNNTPDGRACMSVLNIEEIDKRF